jgi:hypothetical protein
MEVETSVAAHKDLNAWNNAMESGPHVRTMLFGLIHSLKKKPITHH